MIMELEESHPVPPLRVSIFLKDLGHLVLHLINGSFQDNSGGNILL